MKINVFTYLMIQLVTQLCFAHGEDKPGPNGGYIRMPGAFHTELVFGNDNLVKVYLLDINWKNPITKKSSVQLQVNNDKNLVQCQPEKNYFICRPTQKVSKDLSQRLTIKAQRDQQIGTDAVYDFPISLTGQDKKQESKMNHQHH